MIEGIGLLYSTGCLENPVPTNLKYSVLQQSQALPADPVSEGGLCAGMTLFHGCTVRLSFSTFYCIFQPIYFDKVHTILVKKK